MDKKYQKKKKIAESDVTGQGLQPSEVEMLLKTITQYESVIFKKEANKAEEETNRNSDSTSDKISPTSVQ